MTGSSPSTMEKPDIETVRAVVHKILVMYPYGVTREELLKEYQDIAGEDLPYIKLGFNSLMAFVDTVPDAGHITESGEFLYMLHVASVEQNASPTSVPKPARGGKKAKRPRSMTSSTPSTMEKPDIETVRAVVHKILVMYPEGVTREELLKEYKGIAGEDLPYQQLGFKYLMTFVDTVPDAGHITESGEFIYVLTSAEQKAGPASEPKPTRRGQKTIRPRMRPRRTWGNRRYANSLRRKGLRPAANGQPPLPTPTGYDFSGSVQRPVVNRQPLLPPPASYDFSDSVQRPTGYDFSSSMQHTAPFLETPVHPARHVFSWGGPLRDAILESDFTTDRYYFRYSNSIVPKTERHLYDGDDMNPTGYDRLDYVDRPSMKRRYSDDVDASYDQFCSEYATSRKRIRLDAPHPVWCGPSTDPIFDYRQPRYVYTPRQHSDIATYKRLVREDATSAHIRVCRSFVTTMDCEKGDMCWFLHVPGHQLTMPDRDRFNLPRRQCCYYLATGCPWEDRCTRLHVSNHDITPEDRHRLRLPKMASCRYHAAKECIFGESCEWNHSAKDVKEHAKDHMADNVIRTSPEKKLMNKLMDQFDLDCLEDVELPEQTSGNDCGVHALQICRSYLFKETFTMDEGDVSLIRKRIAIELASGKLMI